MVFRCLEAYLRGNEKANWTERERLQAMARTVENRQETIATTRANGPSSRVQGTIGGMVRWPHDNALGPKLGENCAGTMRDWLTGRLVRLGIQASSRSEKAACVTRDGGGCVTSRRWTC